MDRYGNYSDMIKAFEKKIEKKFNRMAKKRVSSNFKCETLKIETSLYLYIFGKEVGLNLLSK